MNVGSSCGSVITDKTMSFPHTLKVSSIEGPGIDTIKYKKIPSKRHQVEKRERTIHHKSLKRPEEQDIYCLYIIFGNCLFQNYPFLKHL